MSKPSNIEKLLAIMAQLRDPNGGCPWDVEQDFNTIAPYTIEEAYEVADAIDNEDYEALRDELGDLLLQVVFHAQMAQEKGLFQFCDVVDAVSDKMVRRHPHVFGDATIKNAAAQTAAWEKQKAAERSHTNTNSSALDDIPQALPALLRALKLQKRAARVGFDWAHVDDVVAKIKEEIAELAEELAKSAQPSREALNDAVADEYGDLLFVCTNLGRHLGLNPEEALRQANNKFERRFRAVEERLLAQGSSVEAATLEEMEASWTAVKKEEKNI